MIDIQAGDVVVCVDDGPCPCCKLRNPTLRRGRAHRITRVFPRRNGKFGVLVTGAAPLSTHGAFNARRFEKLDKATEEFTARVKAVRPIKQREDA